MSEKLYWNPLSNNARVVYYFAVASGIDLDLAFIDMSKGEHKSPDFLKINPCGQVPALSDGEKNLFEGSSIIRYLSLKHGSDLYPFHNPRRLGQVDTVYQYIRSSLWKSHSTFVYQKFFSPSVYWSIWE